MNTFAHIKPIARYKKVAYYSVCMNEDVISVFEHFITCHENTEREKLNHVLAWIKQIGDKYGAQAHFFRPEAESADAAALPPKGKDRKPQYTEFGKAKANDLRLYCLRANEKVVFLFGGAIKTKQKAQECPNVKSHFKLANQLTKAIDNAFKEKEIKWIEGVSLIDVEDDFKLNL